MKIENVLYLMTNLFAFQRLIHTTINHTVSSFQMHNFLQYLFLPLKDSGSHSIYLYVEKEKNSAQYSHHSFFPSLDCKLSFASLSSSLPQCETLADCVCTNLMANKQKIWIEKKNSVEKMRPEICERSSSSEMSDNFLRTSGQ